MKRSLVNLVVWAADQDRDRLREAILGGVPVWPSVAVGRHVGLPLMPIPLMSRPP